MKCANCNKDLEFTEVYSFYYGKRKGSSSVSNNTSIKTTTTYEITGEHKVNLCGFCVLLKQRNSNILFLLMGYLMAFFIFFVGNLSDNKFLKIGGLIIFLITSAVLLTSIIKTSLIINRQDIEAAKRLIAKKKEQDKAIKQDDLYKLGCKLAIELNKPKMNDYDSFFTPEEYDRLL
jgi:hypothetical protein